MVSLWVALAGLPFLLGGGLVLWYGGRLAVGLFRRRWQTRTVEVTIVEAVATEREDGGFEPTVRFRYDYDGETFEATEVREGQDPPSGPREVVDSFLSNYDEGETVTATLLSGTPERAVLEPSTDTWPYVVAATTTLVGSAFTLLGCGIFLSGIFG